MSFDVNNPVVGLCVAGVQVEGTPTEALALYDQAWAARTDDFDAAVAAHYVARLQPTADLTLHWNEVALHHADALHDDRLHALLPSLRLNLAESYRIAGRDADARAVAQRAYDAVDVLPAGGYADMVRGGITRLRERLASSSSDVNV